MNILFTSIATFITSLILLSLSVNFLGKYFVDVPNSRSSHNKKKAKGGGYIFVLNSIYTSIVNLDLSLIIAIPLAIIGLLDDKINLSRKLSSIGKIPIRLEERKNLLKIFMLKNLFKRIINKFKNL